MLCFICSAAKYSDEGNNCLYYSTTELKELHFSLSDFVGRMEAAVLGVGLFETGKCGLLGIANSAITWTKWQTSMNMMFF